MTDAGQGRTAWRAEGVPLKTLEIFITGSGVGNVSSVG
jgi:hypothetical protein